MLPIVSFIQSIQPPRYGSERADHGPYSRQTRYLSTGQVDAPGCQEGRS